MAISLTTKLISELGNSTGSVLPIWVKDFTQDTATTLVYGKNGGKHDGKEKAIEEYGTGLVWVCGIPFMKKLIDKTAYKVAKINPNFDVRKLKEGAADTLEFSINKAKKYAKEDLPELEKIAKNKNLTKGLFIGKFIVSTAVSTAALAGLINLKQKSTEKEIKKELLAQDVVQKNIEKDASLNTFAGKSKNGNISFKGIPALLSNFMYNPVWNMSILDGAISTTRLAKARDGERGEVLFKEASAISFFYLLAGPIQKGLEKLSEKVFKKPIDLDYKVLADDEFVKSIKDGSLKNAIQEFKQTDKQGVEVLEYVWENQESALTQALKKTGVVKTKGGNGAIKNILKKFGKQGETAVKQSENAIDPLKYMDPKEILGEVEKLEKFVKNTSLENLQKHMKATKGLKIASILGNIAITVAFLGIIQPLLAIKRREIKNGGDKENPAVKAQEMKLKNQIQK